MEGMKTAVSIMEVVLAESEYVLLLIIRVLSDISTQT